MRGISPRPVSGSRMGVEERDGSPGTSLGPGLDPGTVPYRSGRPGGQAAPQGRNGQLAPSSISHRRTAALIASGSRPVTSTLTSASARRAAARATFRSILGAS